MENRVGFDIHITLGGPDLLRVVKIQERIGYQEDIGIKIGRIAHVGDERCHLPDDKVSGPCRKWLSHGIKVHFPTSAEDVTVIVFLIDIRILSVTQSIEYQKIFHTHEGTEDFPLIKIS
jgi:hypothetical protein